MLDRRMLRRITLFIVGASALLTLATLVFGGVTMGLGAAVGGSVAVANWLVMPWVGERLMRANDKGRIVWSLLLVLKMAALLGLVALILSTGLVDPMGFTVGLSGLVLGGVAAAFHMTTSGGSTAAREEQG